MKINILPKSEKGCEQMISRWSNGNIHFILNYDSNGKLIDDKVETYYINGEIKTLHFFKNSITEGEFLSFEPNDKSALASSEGERKNFLNE